MLSINNFELPGAPNSASSSAELPQARRPKPPSVAKGASPVEHLRAGPPKPIEGVTFHANPVFIKEQKEKLFQRLILILAPPRMLPDLVRLISEYAVSVLTVSPSCHTLVPESGFLFAGFNVGNVSTGRDNTLFLTRISDEEYLPTDPRAQLIRIEEEEGAFVSSTWDMPYNSSYGERRNEVQTVQTGERSFYFETLQRIAWACESDKGPYLTQSHSEEVPLTNSLAFYDPSLKRVWRKEDSALIGLPTDRRSAKIRCTPNSWDRYQNVLFGNVVSPSRMIAVHQDAIRLFSTTDVDHNNGHCRELHSYSLNMESPLLFITATSIPSSTRFIAALSNTGIMYLSPDLRKDRFVVQHDFVLKAQEMVGNNILGVYNMASNSTAVAIITELKPPSDSNTGYFGFSLWDHESTQRISHFSCPYDYGSHVHGSWFTDNGVLIISHGTSASSHGTRFRRGRAVGTLSLIDFRVSSARESGPMGVLHHPSSEKI